MSQPQEVLDVLAWVNRVRREHQLGPALGELPKGRRRKPDDCPIALALSGASVTYAQARMSDGTRTLPGYVREFARGFDAGFYPELIA